MVNVTHNDNDRIAGLKLLCLILVLVEQLLLDGDVNFLLDLAAHFLRNDSGGIEVDDLGDGRHDAELDETLDNVRCGALHAGSQFTDRDLVRDHDLDRNFLERCHLLLTLEAAHLLLLLLTALVAERLGALVGLLGELLLLRALGLHALRLCVNELVNVVVVLGEVDVAGTAGVDAVHLLDLGRGRSRLLRLLDRLLLRLFRRLLGLALGLLCAEGSLDVLYLMMLSHILEDDRKIRVVENLHMVLRLGAVLGHNFHDFLGGYTEVLRDLVHPVFIV